MCMCGIVVGKDNVLHVMNETAVTSDDRIDMKWYQSKSSTTLTLPLLLL